MTKLSDILRSARKQVTGTTVEESGAVTITPNNAGQPTTITTSDDTAAITVADTTPPQVTLGSGQAVTEVSNVINPADPNNGFLLANVSAIEARIEQALGSALTFVKIDSKADFDTFLSGDPIDPSSVLVTDSVAFDYTDTNGIVNTQITYWQGIVNHPVGGDLTSNTLATSNSSNTMSGAEISAALFAEADTNNLTDARANVTDTISNTVTTGLNTKVDKVSGQGLSNNNLTNDLKTKIDNTPNNTNTALSEKLDVVSNNVNLSLTNPGNGNGRIEFSNEDAPSNQKTYHLVSTSNGHLAVHAVEDNGSVDNEFHFGHNGNFSADGQITQNNNNVLDVTDSKYVNIPTDTNAAIALKEDSVAGLALSENSFTDAEQSKLAGLSAFNGGTINNDLVSVSDDKTAITIKNIDNATGFGGIAWQNSGTTYIASLNRSGVNDDIWLSIGNDVDIDNLEYSTKFNNDRSVTMFGDLTVENDIITTNNGNANISGAITAAISISSNSFIVNSAGDIALSNSLSPANKRNTRLRHDIEGEFLVELLDGSNVETAIFKFKPEGMLDIQSLSIDNNVIVNSNDRNSIILKPSDNSLANSGISFQNSGSFYASCINRNPDFGLEIAVGSDEDPANLPVVASFNDDSTIEFTGDVTITGNLNVTGSFPTTGNKLDKHYYQVYPTVSANDIISEWVGSSVYFVSTGSGTTALPTIVGSNPSNNEFQPGDWFYIYNFNSGANITLTQATGQEIWIRDTVGDIVNGNITLGLEEGFKITVCDFTELASIPNNFGYMVSRLYSV